jgi:hypothetical protein
MTSLHEVLQWGEMAKGLMGRVPPSRVACLPEYFMYCNYLKRLGTRQVQNGYEQTETYIQYF